MSRYDDLRDQYCRYRVEADRLRLDYQRLPGLLAERLTAHLGCPASFEDPAGGGARAYVSPALVVRRTEGFGLLPFIGGEAAAAQVETADDGRFYFALCLALEPRAGATPTERFAVLLSALETGDVMKVRVEDTRPKFEVALGEPDDERDLLGEICGVVEDALDLDRAEAAATPLIGFVRFDL